MKTLAAGLGGLALGLGVALTGHAQAPGLAGLARVALEIELPPELAELDDDILRRVEARLGERQPAPRLEAASPNRLRLVVRVEARSASELRGFWLPFSGQYAIGSIRLGVERPVTLPGGPSPARATLPGVVWQAERLVAAPWRSAGDEVRAAVDELLDMFLDDYRQAR